VEEEVAMFEADAVLAWPLDGVLGASLIVQVIVEEWAIGDHPVAMGVVVVRILRM
jgi:hypothetical protein